MKSIWLAVGFLIFLGLGLWLLLLLRGKHGGGGCTRAPPTLKSYRFVSPRDTIDTITLTPWLELGQLTSMNFARELPSIAFGTTKKGIVYMIDHFNRTANKIADLARSHPDFFAKGMETGLMSVACHPKTAQNGLLYLSYTVKGDNENAVFLVVEECKYLPDMKEMERVRDLFRQGYTEDVHHAGTLAFSWGREPQLYLSSGDGGPQRDPEGHAQNLSSYRGKILRLPLAENGSPDIVAMGLRNPWKISINKKNQMLIGDVGYSNVESIYILNLNEARGHPPVNYGWPVWEGSIPGPAGHKDLPATGFTFPVFEYPISNETGRATLGGYFISDTVIVIGDWLGYIRVLTRSEDADAWFQAGETKASGQLYSLACDASMSQDGDSVYALGLKKIWRVDIAVP